MPFRGALAGAWRKGYEVALAGGGRQCPYAQHSFHGATWPYQMARAWTLGWDVGQRELERAQGGTP